jgi:hypothetical protein
MATKKKAAVQVKLAKDEQQLVDLFRKYKAAVCEGKFGEF